MRLRLAVAAMVLLGLPGCATNALRVEYAGQVAREGQAAATASNSFLDSVADSRRETNLDLFAADPSCARPRARLRADPTGGPPGIGSICVADPNAAPGTATPLSLRPLVDEFRPTLILIDALGSYADALTQIIEAEPADPVQQFRDAYETAKAAQDLLKAVFKTPEGPIPDGSDPRLKALEGFIAFVGELAHEKAQVEQLRSLAANSNGASVIVKELRTSLEAWENARKGDEALRTGIVAAQLNRLTEANPPASPGDRRAAMQAFYARSAAADRAGALFPALDRLLLTVAATDTELRALLRDNPDLSPEQRRRRAEIARQRLVRAFNAVTSIINAFRKA